VTGFHLNSAGFGASLHALLRDEGPRTPRDLIERSAGGAGHRLLAGTPEEIAVDLENFATLVVPILQKRGIFHSTYPDPTLRGRLFGKVPA
jgi:alkanesulfonate monooxygenase SsuD/methylene tetrahydromethanopterin reductase-like flavin-dependent oxidoreductase (luciferase family)